MKTEFDTMAGIMPLIHAALEKWGFESQSGMAIEECAEFIVALRKMSRVGGRGLKPDAEAHAQDECADVLFTTMQMAVALGWEKVMERLQFKADRLEQRMEPTKNFVLQSQPSSGTNV